MTTETGVVLYWQLRQQCLDTRDILVGMTVCIARAVLSQYPFLKSPTGTPHVRELRTMVVCLYVCVC